MTSPPPLRAYQQRAVSDVEARWRDGVKRVCLVLPTGGGKTRCAVELAHSTVLPARHRVLWLAHRKELLEQAAGKLSEAGADVALISPDHPPDPWASIQVASLDTLVARGLRPAADLVVHDECHHAGADTYAAVLADYADAYHLGLTATPQRRDGRPLGEHYDALVVGAQYSELIELWRTSGGTEGIVPCRVRRAPEYLGSDLARSPLEEWLAVAGGRLTFAFAPTVERAHEWAGEFNAAGIPSACIEGNTSAEQRNDMLADFRAGAIRVLWNVYVLTEGVDVPQAECCLLSRGVGHAGTCLQMVGRVLRPSPGKRDALLLDMSGATWLHGLPTADRLYSLTGRSIGVAGEALKNCPQCGSVLPSAQPECPDCGYVWQKQERRAPKIWNLELQWAAEEAGGIELVGDDLKRREWDRLMALVETRPRWSVSFARAEYEKLFGEAPKAEWLASHGVQMKELAKLIGVRRQKGYKEGWVGFRFKSRFGRWPSREQMMTAEALAKGDA